MEEMTPFERVQAVCAGDIPDRVPFILASREFGMRYAGLPLSAAFTSPESYIGAQLKMAKDFSQDAVWDIWAVPVTDEALGATLVIPEDDSPYVDYHPFLSSIDELEKIPSIDPYKDGRMPYMLDLVHALKKRAGREMPVIGWVSQPFRTACMLRGEANLYRDMIKHPDAVLDLVRIAYDAQLAYGKALIDAGADIIATSNPVANQECISRKSYLRFSHPFTRDLFGALKAEGDILTMYHTCGKWDDRLGDVVEENVDIVHLDKVDLKKFKETYGNKAVAFGNIRTSETLLAGSRKQVQEEALTCLREAKEGGRFILSANCAVPRDTPPQNVRTLCEVVREYGRY